MIKFFRNLRLSLLGQNKTSKYVKYALGEIILVVIGILIALSLNNWNANRKLAQQETILLTNLKLEMEENLLLLDSYLKKKQELSDAYASILTLTSPNYQKVEEDSIEVTFEQIFRIYNFQPDNMVLEAAKSSNSLELIQDQQIKIELSRWEQILNSLRNEETFGNDQYNNSLIPIISNYFPFKSLDQLAGRSQDVSQHPTQIDILFKNKLFENSAFRTRTFQNRSINEATILKEQTQLLVEILGKELGNNWISTWTLPNI